MAQWADEHAETGKRRGALVVSVRAAPRRLAPAYAIVVCCSCDLRVCDHACDLLAAGFTAHPLDEPGER